MSNFSASYNHEGTSVSFEPIGNLGPDFVIALRVRFTEHHSFWLNPIDWIPQLANPWKRGDYSFFRVRSSYYALYPKDNELILMGEYEGIIDRAPVNMDKWQAFVDEALLLYERLKNEQT